MVTRKLGIPAVVDKVFQQAITQVLSPVYEEQFLENNFGFRPKKGAHDALKQCQQNVIEGKLFLKENRKKTSVAHISKVKYLGYAFYRYKGKCRFRVHPRPVEKMKDKIRELAKRSNGWGNEYSAMKLTQFVRVWVNYFSLADMKGLLREIDEWLRHKIRTIYWKQWKKIKTKFKKLGVEEEKAWIYANMRNGNWYCGGYFVLKTAFNNKKLRELGYPTFIKFYLKVCEN